MAVHAISGTLTASTVAAVTLTSWQRFVSVTLTGNGTAAPAYITVDGSTPTIGGADETMVQVPASGSVTVMLKNLLPAPELSTTTPAATDPSAVPAFTTAQTKVAIISAQALPYNIELSNNAGNVTVLA
jgi:hypothetical protein